MESRSERALEVVHRHVGWALASGILPLPVVDIAAVTLVNVRMLEQVAEIYEMPYSRVRAGAHVTSLLGSLGSAQLAFWLLSSGASMIPGLGLFLKSVPISVTSGSLTYTIGRIFIEQFERGGTFLDFDPQSVKGRPLTPVPDAVAARREPPVKAAPPPALTPAPPVAAHPVAARPAGGADDLAIVKGIGPKIAALLAEKGIHTFAQLSQTSVEALRDILNEAGLHYANHDPSTWPEQGRVLAEDRP